MTMSRITVPALTTLAGCLALAACTLNGDIVFNIKDATVTFDTAIDVNDVKPGQVIPVSVDTTNVYLVEPGVAPPPAQAANAGHIQIYLDDVATPPLVITAQVEVKVTVPVATPHGKHKFICRVHKHDGTPTTATFEMSFTVTATTGVVDMAVAPNG